MIDNKYNPSEIEDKCYKEWEENNKPDLLQNATAKKKKILENVFPDHISAETDALIRQQHNILLNRKEDMV